MRRFQIAPGVHLSYDAAQKFNRCRITLHLRFPARRESATDAAVLALVLERGYAACPDMTALSRRLAELYGADLGVDLASAGTDRVLSADICGIKDAYALAGENLTDAYADIVFGTLATLLACLVTYKLRDIRVKGLAIPASLPPVVFNMLIVGAFEITFFFSDTAPTLALACFNAVAVAIGELISCTVLGVALVKLIESNESLKKIFTEE